jgi:hypothetical protein
LISNKDVFEFKEFIQISPKFFGWMSIKQLQ